MKVKTSELTGSALDWAVMQCEGTRKDIDFVWWTEEYSPSTIWSQGGPIIELERIGFKYTGTAMEFVAWVNGELSTVNDQHGPTPLIAAMRCYVASQLGDEVEIPRELAK